MRVEIWSDVVCPWCYVGKRRFERALAVFPHRDEVEVTWRAFELDERAPRVRDADYATHLATKYRTSPAEAQAMIDRMTGTAAAEGIEMRFDIARPGNTFDAHRLMALAAERGVQDALATRLFRATFTEGAGVGDHDTLARLAAEAGLDKAEARAVLASDRYANDVRADEALARSFGATGVPFFVFDRALGVSGAQPAEVFTQVLERAYADRSPLTVVATGDACDDEACAV